jgi:hypothetical protein
MEALSFLGGIIVVLGGIWTIQDLLEDTVLLKKAGFKKRYLSVTQTCSGFKSRDIKSSTACRAGL